MNSKNSGAKNQQGKRVNGLTKVKDEEGRVMKVVLYDADPKCKHELDPTCWSGIKCKKCAGWFCA